MYISSIASSAGIFTSGEPLAHFAYLLSHSGHRDSHLPYFTT